MQVADGNWVFNGNLSTFGWDDKDGNKAPTFRDLDGSVTGQSNTQVVPEHPFYTGPECVSRVNWGMTVCPYKYVQVSECVRNVWGMVTCPYKYVDVSECVVVSGAWLPAPTSMSMSVSVS